MPILAPAHRRLGGRFKPASWDSNKKGLTTTERGYGADWRKTAAAVMRRDLFMCQPCLRAGRDGVPAAEVDHIKNKASFKSKTDPAINHSLNLQAICVPCHRAKTRAEAMRGKAATLPYLDGLCAPLTIVCGPPGSGKSTYVADNALDTDEVIDLDVIISQLTDQPLYVKDIGQLTLGLIERNTRLARIQTPAWLIVTAGRRQERAHWQQYGELIVMPTSKDVCAQRVLMDERRPADVKAQHVKAIQAWL